MVGIIAGAPFAVEAGRYEIVRGAGTEICEAYQNNLNSLGPAVPMMCERRINPDDEHFRKPVWDRIDVSDVMDRIDDFLWKRDANPAYYIPMSRWRGTKEQYREARRNYAVDRSRRSVIGHLAAKIDIDNDGQPENVYLDKICGSSFGSLLLVLNDQGSDIDRAKTALVMRHPSRATRRLPDVTKHSPPHPVGDSLHKAHYDVFQYNGKTYFDLWWEGSSYTDGASEHVEQLRVFIAQKKQVREVCTYRFVME
ncbi:MAG TPA: hypothetical protein VKE95_06345 [Burkholderiales bacterium]|nr:hypothetical protein [Burkholderiales bacterium]